MSHDRTNRSLCSCCVITESSSLTNFKQILKIKNGASCQFSCSLFVRLFLALSSLMLLTQRITSLSLDLLEKRVTSTLNTSWTLTLLPLMGYLCSFTTLLGGPLCSYTHFVSQIEKMEVDPPPNPLRIVLLKLAQVFALQCLRYFFVVILKHYPFNPLDSTFMHGTLWVWGLGVVLRLQYYSHWKVSECLNNSAGFGFNDSLTGEKSNFSDGNIQTTESSTCMSEFARRWNATTASWLRRLVYTRSKRFPLYMTFGFSLWWHGLHLGHFVGFLTWAATVHADYHIHRSPSTISCAALRGVCTCLGWINTQLVISCIVVAVEFRTLSALRVIFSTPIGFAPLCNIILPIVLMTVRKVN